jgi:transcriptional regulator with XRE-family HTH domain
MTRTVDDPTRQRIAQRLRSARISRNLSQRDLAERLQISHDTLSNYEQGKRVPPLSFLMHYADMLGVDVTYFFLEADSCFFYEEQREALALLSSLSPQMIDFVVAFVQLASRHERHRRWHFDGEERLVAYLERELSIHIDEPIESLVSFVSLMLMTLGFQERNEQVERLIQRMGARGHRLVVVFRAMMEEHSS